MASSDCPHQVEYRYCVCIVLEPRPGLHERTVVVRRWETNLLPRRLRDGGEREREREGM
ncbi:hypothetical protein E2C01_098211 [Portunus trituberculatus]|uniref:Uncharacterized protein n=1 Tax=Portunus trituberculatus TaxID=210409 RepID=A0A5B7K7T9_PORTR|nr:hypothetical protein [Portunus trituberculatus]